MGKRTSHLLYAAVAIVTFMVANNIGYALGFLRLQRIFGPEVRLAVRDVLQVALSLWGLMIAHKMEVSKAWRELGLRAPIARAVSFAIIASLPMLVGFAWKFGLNSQMSVVSIAVGCFIAPFAEEVLFRGYIFRQLYRRARWPFWLAVAVPSVLFALGHMYQATNAAELVGIMGITGLASVLGCWMFVRWQDNLWVVIALHSLMNLWWEVFGVDNTALGGATANVARTATIALAILLTVFKDRIWPLLEAERRNVLVVTEQEDASVEVRSWD